jgi:hypothetical protein
MGGVMDVSILHTSWPFFFKGFCGVRILFYWLWQFRDM